MTMHFHDTDIDFVKRDAADRQMATLCITDRCRQGRDECPTPEVCHTEPRGMDGERESFIIVGVAAAALGIICVIALVLRFGALIP